MDCINDTAPETLKKIPCICFASTVSLCVWVCVSVYIYVCVCVRSSNFILTSVVLTGLSWGAVLTDGHKEKQQKSEV